MKSYQLQLVPRDVLFLRDARPMAASDAGRGANWPRPDQLWNAIIHHFHRCWPEMQSWEGAQHRKRDGERDSHRLSSDRFGALCTVGPFPFFNGMPYFPWPEDLVLDEDGVARQMRLMDTDGTDLQDELTKMFSTPVMGKQNLPKWLALNEYQKYLAGEAFRPSKVNLYEEERNIGIAIDSTTNATVKGQLYQAEYLRLCDQVTLAFQATCMIKPKGDSNDRQLVDVLAKTELPAQLIIGGQQGVATINNASWQLPGSKPPSLDKDEPLLLRWTLLSPALFPEMEEHPDKNPHGHPGGWRPTWTDPQTGQVKLPRPVPEIARMPSEDRLKWRQRRRQLQENIKAKLVAARVGKAQYFSGWDLQQKVTDQSQEKVTQGPKPTQAAVPAGSVYVFACENQQALQELWQTLQAENDQGKINRRSASFGEKGFGIGVCSIFPGQN